MIKEPIKAMPQQQAPTLLKGISEQLVDYGRLMRLDKPIGTYLLLWPTLWALWIAAGGFPEQHLFIIFVLGVILMRAAGCIINDIADRNIDGRVERTSDRPLATGRVSSAEALMLFAVLVGLSFYLVLLTNKLTILLAAAAVILAALYPFMKRVTYLPQIFLGAAFSMGVPMAFAAQTGGIPSHAWLIFTANLIWTVAYDTIYAMVDKKFDLQIGVKSSAILFGDSDKLAVAALQLITLVALYILGRQIELGAWYFASLVIVFFLFVYQQFLIKDRDVYASFNAFLNNHWVGMVIFIGILMNYGYAQ